MTTLHTLNDGSKVRVIQAKELIQIPIWNGQRLKSDEHVKNIKDSISDIKNLDFGFRIVSMRIENADGKASIDKFVVDGQHRHQVLSDYFKENLCSPDFPIVIVEKEMGDETDIITYFHTINRQKAIPFKTDPKMIANKYIEALSEVFNTKKEKLIRDKTTKRPYLSVEKLRDELVKRVGLAKGTVKDFMMRVCEYNKKELNSAGLNSVFEKKDDDIRERAVKLKFMLAIDTKLSWISECV